MLLAPLSAEFMVDLDWTNIQTTTTSDMANYSVKLPSGDVITAGGKELQNPDNTYNLYPYIMRISPAGEVVWSTGYRLSAIENVNTEAIYVSILSTGNLFVGCKKTTGGGFFMIINPQNASVVSSAFPGYDNVDAYTLSPTDQVYVVDNIHPAGDSPYFTLSKYSTGGILSATATYRTSGTYNQAESITPLPDNSFLVAGEQDNKALVLKYNSSLQLVNTYILQPYTYLDYSATQIAVSGDGSMFVAGESYTQGEYNGFIIKTNEDGEIQWSNGSGSRYNSVAILDDGKIAVAGVYGNINSPRNYVCMFNNEGEYIWGELSTDYYGHHHNIINSGLNEFLAVGWNNDHSGTYQSNWILKHYHSWMDNDIVVTEILPFEPTWENNIVEVMATDTLLFSITAYDPDNNQLTYHWTLDGELVSATSSFSFESELSQENQSFGLWLYVTDASRNMLSYFWQVNVLPYVNPPYEPSPLYPYDTATNYLVDSNPALRWAYSWDLAHSQDRSVLYLGTNYQGIADLNPAYKVQDDGTLHDSYNFTMAPNQTYYWRVVAYNGTQSTTGAVWSFSTESIVNSFPWVQDFEGGNLPPVGWNNLDSPGISQSPQPGMGGGWGAAYEAQYIHAGSGAMSCTPYQMPQYYWLQSPLINIRSSSQLHFWVNYQSSSENPTELYVMIKTALGWQQLYSFDSPVKNNVYASEVVIPLGAYYGQNARIAFVYNCSSGANTVAVDDIIITADAALPVPQNVQIVKNGTQVQLSWDSASAEELFKVDAAISPEGPWTQISGESGFSRVGSRTYWSTSIAGKAFYKVTRYTP
jgi:hypothetical protein